MISVIIPVYNVEFYLRRSIESVRGQSFQDWELILIDDGSTDQSGAVCDRYSELDSRIKTIHKQNGGAASARNVGIDWVLANSSSQWIAFVDSDDEISPDYLSVLYRTAMQYAADLSICDFEMIESDGSVVPNKFSIPELHTTGNTLLEENVIGSNWRFAVPVNKLYRKKLFEGLRFPEGYICEDEALLHHILAAAGTVVCISDRLYFYVRREDSVMGSGKSIKITDVLTALSDRIQFASRNHYSLLYNQTLRGYYLAFHNTHYPLLLKNGKGTIYPRRVARATRAILPDLLRLSYWTRREKLELILFSLFPHLQLAASRRRERKNRVSG